MTPLVLFPLSFVLSSVSSRRVHHARSLTFYVAACSWCGMTQSRIDAVTVSRTAALTGRAQGLGGLHELEAQ